MTLHFNFIVQNNQFHFIPKIRLHIPSYENDFYVFSITWLFFNFMVTTHELLSMSTYWRMVVKAMIDDDPEVMQRLETLVNNYMQYTDEQFLRKAKYIANGCIN